MNVQELGKSLSKTKAELYALLLRIGSPVLDAGKQGLLKTMLPPRATHVDRSRFSHLEAVGRLLSGIAPALELNHFHPEDKRFGQEGWGDDARTLLSQVANPESTSSLNFDNGQQPLVDAALLALSFLRAPQSLWWTLSETTRSHLIDALRSTRQILPPANNWILFQATIEAFFCHIEESFDQVRIDYALRQTDQWYVGDGWYKDGPEFHFNYYNSIIIHPLLLEITKAIKGRHIHVHWEHYENTFLERAQRHAKHLSSMITAEGSYPLIGRSLTYRSGVFHLLSLLLWQAKLDTPSEATTIARKLHKVALKTTECSTNWTKGDWLSIGVHRHQPEYAESYISTGSLYFIANSFLHLGVPQENQVWHYNLDNSQEISGMELPQTTQLASTTGSC